MGIAYVITRADEIGERSFTARGLASATHAAGHQVTVLAGMAGVLFDQLAYQGVPFRLVSDLVRPIAPHRDFRSLVRAEGVPEGAAAGLGQYLLVQGGWVGRLAARQLRLR